MKTNWIQSRSFEKVNVISYGKLYFYILQLIRATWWRSWLRHCATSRKVAGSIPDGVIGIFHLRNPSGRTVALGLTQPLTEMSTTNISSGCKGGRSVGLTNLPPSCADCREIWQPQTSGTFRACPGLYRDCFTFYCRVSGSLWPAV